MPAEIVLIGGAAVLANYGFRDSTTDVDAVIHAASSLKDAVNSVGDRFGLPNGWLNADFMRTSSYTPKLDQYSVYYKTFSNVLTVRTVTAEYLIAMKLMSGRQYKHDLSDIIGILAEHEKRGTPVTAGRIDTAVLNLYGSWEKIPSDARRYIDDLLQKGSYEELFAKVVSEERRARDAPVGVEQNYPGRTNESSVDNILANLRSKQESRTALLSQLQRMGMGEVQESVFEKDKANK